jgi:large subunit ribosomal protein L4
VELTIHKPGAGKQGAIKVSDAVFAVDYNEPLVHQVLTAFMAGSRAGTKAQKTRSDVSGGGRKPWKQKGTGRARAGTTRSPLWRGGGVTFAARNRNFTQKVNRKMYQGAIRSILSELARQERLLCIESFTLDSAKTRAARDLLGGLGLREVLIVTDEVTENAYLAVRNLPYVDLIDTAEINPYCLIGYEKVLLTKAALEKMEAWLS